MIIYLRNGTLHMMHEFFQGGIAIIGMCVVDGHNTPVVTQTPFHPSFGVYVVKKPKRGLGQAAMYMDPYADNLLQLVINQGQDWLYHADIYLTSPQEKSNPNAHITTPVSGFREPKESDVSLFKSIMKHEADRVPMTISIMAEEDIPQWAKGLTQPKAR